MRQLIAIFLISLLAVSLANAMGGKPPQAVTRATVRNGVRLSLQISTDRDRYRAGEPVKIKLSVKNESSEDFVSQFSSGQSFDIKIYDEEGSEIWSWAYSRVFTQAIRPFRLDAGEVEEWEEVWEQRDNSQKRVSPGKYFVAGEITLVPRLYTARKEIVVE